MNQSKNILVVSPHPDDETLGAGGTIRRLIHEGKSVSWLNITGIGNNPRYLKNTETRKKQLGNIQKFYNFSRTINLELPTAKLDEISDNVGINSISPIFNNIKPDTVILPDYNDAHSDHKKVFEWCFACTKIFRNNYIRHIYTMEIISETDFGHPYHPFIPNFYVDISDYLEDKIAAMQFYDTELGTHPFPRSIERLRALALMRGAEAGTVYAEAYRMIKSIV